MTFYAQYGCGTSAPENWLNFDASPRLKIERFPGVRMLMGSHTLFPANVRFGDIVAGLPVPSNSLKGLYASHILEHLYRADITVALKNSLEILQPGGVFRLIVPDLNWRIQEYLNANGNSKAAEELQKSLHLRPVDSAHGIEGRLRSAIGLSMHQWMYDEPLMVKLLEDAGFTAIRRCDFGDCEDDAFDAVEEEGRFYDSGHKELAIECRKPLSGF